MDEKPVKIRYLESEEPSGALLSVAREVSKILTPNEEILYVALQNVTALSMKKDSALATTNRFIIYNDQLLGRASFDDYHWQDVADIKIQQGMLSTELRVETIDGRASTIGGLDKEQAKRLYGICQQMEQEWREKRRVRDMEEARARAGGIYMAPPDTTSSRESSENQVERLAKAKTMLDQGLISEAEYDTLKAKILSSM